MAVRKTPQMLGFAARQAGLFLYDKLRRRPSRPRRVLQYLRDNTSPGLLQRPWQRWMNSPGSNVS